MGIVPLKDFKEMIHLYPKCHEIMASTILSNPFEIDRNYFVLKCRQFIPYFQDLSDDILKKMYYEADAKIYELD